MSNGVSSASYVGNAVTTWHTVATLPRTHTASSICHALLSNAGNSVTSTARRRHKRAYEYEALRRMLTDVILSCHASMRSRHHAATCVARGAAACRIKE
ncbi:hypothetical protein NPIL_496921 [Nephila pilipes]|uniref:Uncharacterized protein n=1 Tax=Nephila pilipes TaxID=299642 RepID=A0A8X6NMI3_NEPPI|nr:hypothetical protein NPIL_496921 [Nephila pilipes]